MRWRRSRASSLRVACSPSQFRATRRGSGRATSGPGTSAATRASASSTSCAARDSSSLACRAWGFPVSSLYHRRVFEPRLARRGVDGARGMPPGAAVCVAARRLAARPDLRGRRARRARLPAHGAAARPRSRAPRARRRKPASGGRRRRRAVARPARRTPPGSTSARRSRPRRRPPDGWTASAASSAPRTRGLRGEAVFAVPVPAALDVHLGEVDVRPRAAKRSRFRRTDVQSGRRAASGASRQVHLKAQPV